MFSHSSILVLGAGELGLSVLAALAQHPARRDTTITVLLRPSKTSRDFRYHDPIPLVYSMRSNILGGDIVASTVSELAQLFAPYDTIIGCTGMAAPEGTQLKICEAVLLSSNYPSTSTIALTESRSPKKKHYIPWQFGVDYDVIGKDSSQDLFTEQLSVRARLRSAAQKGDITWTVISTGMFTSFLFEPSFGVVSQDREQVNALGAWENAVTVTTPRDIGRVVAEAVYNPRSTSTADDSEVENRVLFTAGDTVTYTRLADILTDLTGRHHHHQGVERRLWTVDHLKEELQQDPENGMRKYRVVFAEGKGVSWDMERTFNYDRGMKMTGVEEWARENLLATD